MATRALCGLMLLLILSGTVGFDRPARGDDRADRIDRMVERLEETRVKAHVPGMAIAVVAGDEVILSRGFGLANVEEGVPVTDETLFAIGSSTKSFTATLVGMLVDEGLMGWDDPVTRHLPWFILDPDTDDADASVTVRDLLCHRTGFARMSILWAGNAVDRETVLRTATGAEPFAGYREAFHYSNVMFMAAGVAAAAAADTDWDTLVAERLLEPLGMSSSNTSVSLSREDPQLARGYLWQPESETMRHLPMRELDAIAPAGAINSNAVDMAQWVRLQLGSGVHDGRRLISETQHGETWKAQIGMGPGISYGLGWMIREWKGQSLIEHGGNIDGFAARVVLLPESNMGFALMANASGAVIPDTVFDTVFSTLLDEPADGAGDAPVAEDFAPFLGRYHANFASFRDTHFTVLVRNDRLAVDVPGQTIYELRPPDAEGKRAFVLTDTIAVSFDHDEEGAVVGMKMYQAGMAFELPREGVEVAIEIPLDELQRYLGTYRSEALGTSVQVLIQNNRLAMDVPGQMVYELEPPDDEGKWFFRITDAIAVSFNETETGAIASLTSHQGGAAIEMERVPGTGAEPPPSVEELATLRDDERRAAAVAAMGGFRMSGTIDLVNSGVTGTIVVLAGEPDRYRLEVDFGDFGRQVLVVDGDEAWSDATFNPRMQLEGGLLEQAQEGHPAATFGVWEDFFDQVSVLRAQTLDERPVVVVKVSGADTPAATLYVDADDGDVLQVEAVLLAPGIPGIPVTMRFEDYRETEGLRIPFRILRTDPAAGRTVVQFETLEAHLDLPDSAFELGSDLQ